MLFWSNHAPAAGDGPKIERRGDGLRGFYKLSPIFGPGREVASEVPEGLPHAASRNGKIGPPARAKPQEEILGRKDLEAFQRGSGGISSVPLGTPSPALSRNSLATIPLKLDTSLGRGNLSGSVSHPSLRSRAASSPLNGLQSARAVLLADRLHRSPVQVMAHRILPGTGHEVPRAARVSPKCSR
jgi:hypothetical protein